MAKSYNYCNNETNYKTRAIQYITQLDLREVGGGVSFEPPKLQKANLKK